MIKTALLADHPETIPTLIRWFTAQWGAYYAQFSPAEIVHSFEKEAQRDGLPIRLVAFVDDDLAGTITLREQAIQSHPDYHPGVGGLLVLEQYRKQGVGTALVRASMALAHKQGFQTLYATTIAAKGVLTRLGWQQVSTLVHDEEQLHLYQYELRTP